MKKWKRVISLLSSVLMLASFAPQGLAEEETVAEPEVLFYRDYEEYTGGANVVNDGKQFGTMTWAFNNYGKSIPEQGFDGQGLKFKGSYGSESARIPESVKNGILYFTLLSEGSDDAKVGNFYFGQNRADMAFFGWRAGQFYYVGNKSWGSTGNLGMQGANTSYKIDIVINLDDQTRDVYINGLNIYSGTSMAVDPRSTVITLSPDNGMLIDDFAAVNYPAGTTPATFSVESAEADAKADKIRVMLKSDAYDSDGKNGEAMEAPYGITLVNENVSNSPYMIAEDSFTVDGMNVLSVERGLRSGEYVLEVDGDIKYGEEYTVHAKADLTDILGSTLNPLADGVTITAQDEFLAQMKDTADGVVVKFNEALYNFWDLKAGAEVKNLYNGKTGKVTLTKKTEDTVLVSGYDFEEGDEYTIILPENLRGISGNTIENNKATFNLGAGGYLKKLNLVDIQGEEHSLEDINPVALDEMEFTFTEDVEAEKYVQNIKITDSESNEEFTDYVAECSGNTATLKLNSILAGGKTYKISITGLRKDYEIALKTEEAAFKRLPVLYLDSEGKKIKSMGDINAGDTVTVRLDFVNATTTSQSFLASACLFSGQEMIGFGCEEVLMDSVADGGSGKFSKEFTFEVSKVTGDLKLKGYMWSMNDGKFAPLEPASVF